MFQTLELRGEGKKSKIKRVGGTKKNWKEIQKEKG